MTPFQSNLRKQIRNLPKILNFFCENYSVLFKIIHFTCGRASSSKKRSIIQNYSLHSLLHARDRTRARSPVPSPGDASLLQRRPQQEVGGRAEQRKAEGREPRDVVLVGLEHCQIAAPSHHPVKEISKDPLLSVFLKQALPVHAARGCSC